MNVKSWEEGYKRIIKEVESYCQLKTFLQQAHLTGIYIKKLKAHM